MRRRMSCILLILLCLFASIACAENQTHYITIIDDIYYATIQQNGKEIRFPVYCMNRELRWPLSSAEYRLDTDDLLQFDGLYEAVQRLLFAGYPTNGLNLYTLNETVEITAEGLNRMLEVPDFILNYTKGDGQRYFDLADADGNAIVIKADGTGMEEATAFVQTVLSADIPDEEKRMIQGSNFYLAIFYLIVNNWDQQATIQSLENAMKPTDYNMWISTQVALYQLLKDKNVPNNTNVALGAYPYAKEIYDFATKTYPSILLTEPGAIQVSGSPVFREHVVDGVWYSDEMQIVPTANYDAIYQLVLPQGYSCVGENADNLRAGRTFRLMCTHKPDDHERIQIRTEVRWPSDLYHFTPVEEQSVHQHMVGAYYNSRQLTLNLNVTAVVPRVPKTGDNYPILLLGALMAISAAALQNLAGGRKKHNKEAL